MARKQDQDDSYHAIAKELLRPYLQIGLAILLPYVIVGAIIVWVVASAYPTAAAVVGAMLLFILAALVLLFLRLRRRFVHYLMARRADKQDAAYVKGDDRRGVHGKFRPEDLG